MWRKLVPVVVILAALIAAIVWKMSGGSAHDDAPAAAHGSASGVRTGPRPPAAPASIAGHVTKQGGGAIAGATVAIARAELDMGVMTGGSNELVVVVADASGAWSAPQVAPGSYAISASARGFLPARHERITIGAGEHRDGVDLVLAPGGTLVHGMVADVGGGGIPGARVSASADSFDTSTLLRREAPYTTLSGADGKYELALPDGAYRLAATHDDYTSSSHPISVAGKPLVVDFSLVPGAVVRGQVIARDSGKPVPGAIVESQSKGSRMGRGHASATADAEGKFVLRHLGSGNLAVTAFGYGYASQTPSEVSVGIGEQIDGVRVMVDRALSISGRVVEKGSQKGVAGVMVGAGSFTGGGQEARALEPSDKDGAFQIVGVRPGSYMVFAISEDKMPELAKNIEVTDKDVTGLVIELATGATLSGRVDPPGPASIGVSVVGDIGIGNIMDIMKTVLVHADADATGAFVLRHVPAGKFSLVATTAAGPAGSIPITVAETDQTGLVIPLETRGTISGRVVDTNGKTVAGMHVSARQTGGDKNFSMQMAMAMAKSGATSGDDGTFKIVGLEAGKYVVTARDQDDYTSFLYKKDKKADDSIELAAGGERAGVVVTVEAKDGVIRGVVIGSDGQPAADAWVAARPERDKAVSEKVSEYMLTVTTQPVLTNSDGKFVLDHLRKGTYTLIADGPRGDSRAEKTGVATGDTATITLAPLGTLTGHVTARAAPVATYDLVCRGPAGRVDRHVDAADGSYVLGHLAPGHYDCEASADAGTATGSSDVPTGTATLEMQLVPWATMTGTVVSVLTGQPVVGIAAIVQGSNGDGGKAMAQAIFGNGPTTDATGRFNIDRVGAGSGTLTLYSKTDITKALATKPYTATQGQQVDLGAIKVIPPRDGDAGTLGMATEIQGDALAVTLVSPGGPAAAAGVVVGDKITSIDGKAVSDLTPDIAQKVLSSGIIGSGMQVVLGLDRGATVTLTAAKW